MQYPVTKAALNIAKRDKQANGEGHAAGLIRGHAPAVLAASLLLASGLAGWSQEAHDPLLDLMIQKGMLTQEEAAKVKSEADALRTNAYSQALPPVESKWKLSKAIKDVELFGDVRMRFEQRQAWTPPGDHIELDRPRFAIRFGLRGDLFDDFYWGLRLETSTNPRSPWVTLGSSSPAPFGKSADGVSIGQAYFGWRKDWVDITAGKMPNPMYTTPMVWDPDLNPEGLAERFKYTVGNADFFASFGQFVYQDNNPSYLSGSLVDANVLAPSTRLQTGTTPTFLLGYQAGVNYRFSQKVSAKVAGSIYQYLGLVTNQITAASSGGIGDSFIGEGSYGGVGSGAPVNGLTSQNGITYNQVGVNHLLVVDVPFEVNFKISKLNARIFGDFAYNLDGAQRARDAVSALAAQSQLQLAPVPPPLVTYGAQTHDVKAYQVGLSIGNGDTPGLVNGTVARKHSWELRTYWQHVEQYALDPNLLDSDFFEGRGNMEGIYAGIAYALTDNVIGTFRYGYASRINKLLGTGGSNLDIPQFNPIDYYHLFQFDVTLKF